MSFSGVSVADLDKYLSRISPPGIRGAGEHGELPWSQDLFLAKGRDPTVQKTIKDESARLGNSRDQLIMERWRRLAGIEK